MKIGNAAADAIRQRNGTDFLVGTTAEVLRKLLLNLNVIRDREQFRFQAQILERYAIG